MSDITHFKYDVFLSHSSKDKAVAHNVAERLKKDGLRVWFDEWEIKPGDSIPAKIDDGLEQSRILVLCMSANAFSAEWAQLESGTFRFRDPMNKERLFIPLRLDDAPIKGTLAQFLHINWHKEAREREYPKLLDACRLPVIPTTAEAQSARAQFEKKIISLGHTYAIRSVAFSPDGRRALSGSGDKTVRLWDVEGGRCLRVFEGHTDRVRSVAWSDDGRYAYSVAVNGVMRVWEVDEAVAELRHEGKAAEVDVQYTNAKVLLVGDSGVGKSGLSNYLALGVKVEDDKPLPSTDGVWATHWPLLHPQKKDGVDREILLWDFAGQADYRLVHQLFMDDASIAVLVFNPQNENPFEGLGHWDRDLRKAARKAFARLLVAARVDRGGLVVSAASIKKFMKERGFLDLLHLTSAKTGEGCE